MTFEEFLIKKKIDPALLENAEPALFSDFRNQYDQMGVKSFDHSKKFWFNRLRRSYHLKEIPKSVPPGDASLTKEQTPSPVAGKTGYTPRFKAKPSSVPDTLITVPPSPETGTAPKPVYKPRFKAAATPVQENTSIKDKEGAEEKVPEPRKPAYKPRFKPQATERKNPEE